MKRWISIAYCLGVTSFAACGSKDGHRDADELVSIRQGIYGGAVSIGETGDGGNSSRVVEGIQVAVFSWSECAAMPGKFAIGEVAFSATTDDDGFYQIELPEGSYAVKMTVPPYGHPPSPAPTCFQLDPGSRRRYNPFCDLGFWSFGRLDDLPCHLAYPDCSSQP